MPPHPGSELSALLARPFPWRFGAGVYMDFDFAGCYRASVATFRGET